MLTATEMHLHNPMHHPYPVQAPEYQNTPSNASVQIISTIRVLRTLLLWTNIPANWPIIKRAHDGSRGLIVSIIDCQLFATYGIPDELVSDGGPEFTAGTTFTFLLNWGASYRLSSVLLSHTQTVGQKWLLKQPRGSIHHIY